jgi:hypothetical protein
MHELGSFSSGKSAQDIDRRLWLELTPEQYQLVRELIRLEVDAPVPGLDDETERVVDGLAAHFPAFGPAIRAVAQHLIEQGAIYEDGDQSDCCRGPLRAVDERAS